MIEGIGSRSMREGDANYFMYTTDKASCSPVQLTDHSVFYRISTLSFTRFLSECILTLHCTIRNRSTAIKNACYLQTAMEEGLFFFGVEVNI
jgi:hypothetical protein